MKYHVFRRRQLVCLLLLAAASPCCGDPPAAVGEPNGVTWPSPRLLTAYAEIDRRVPDEPQAVFTAAAGVREEFRKTLDSLHEPQQQTTRPPDFQLLDAMQRLGEASQRTAFAYEWITLHERFERQALAAARVRARAANIQQTRAAHAALLTGIAARRQAQRRLWALSEGKARIVREYSSGYQTPATAAETAWFAANLDAFARSPVWVPIPSRVEAKAFHTADELRRILKHKEEVTELKNLLDRELRRIAPAHEAVVRACWKSSDPARRVAAVSSLGWWCEQGTRLLLEALDTNDVPLRRAALAALPRIGTADADIYRRCAAHDCAEVREAVARLLGDLCHTDCASLRTLALLLHDADGRVRAAAFDALERAAALHNIPFDTQKKLVVGTGRNQPPAVLIDAIDWLANQPVLDPAQRSERTTLLRQWAARHRDATVQAAARRALQ